MKFFINTVSRDHVAVGREAGIVQAGHGRKAPLRKLNEGDYVIFYSPKTSLDNGESLQAFTAIARIKDNNIYQSELSSTFKPFRRNVEYFSCNVVPVRPLIEDLEFIENKKFWGFKFRLGLFEINEHDFRLITAMMKADIKD